MRLRSLVMTHSSPAGRVGPRTEATFTQKESDSSTYERVCSSEKAVRSRSCRVCRTTKRDYLPNEPISQTNERVFTSNERTFRPKKVVRRPDHAVSPFTRAVRRHIPPSAERNASVPVRRRQQGAEATAVIRGAVPARHVRRADGLREVHAVEGARSPDTPNPCRSRSSRSCRYS